MIKYYLIIISTAFISAFSQILLNISTSKKHRNRLFEYLNPYVIISYILLVGTLIINIYAMQTLELKVAHALAASSYVFAMFLSHWILKEPITIKKALGNILIILGIIVFLSQPLLVMRIKSLSFILQNFICISYLVVISTHSLSSTM